VSETVGGCEAALRLAGGKTFKTCEARIAISIVPGADAIADAQVCEAKL